jgi:TonB family protein
MRHPFLNRFSPSAHAPLAKLVRTAAFALAVGFVFQASAFAERAILSRVEPEYPAVAKRLKITGAVDLEAVVEPNGKVKLVRTVMGNTVLSEAAKEAVRHWKFAPAANESVEEIEINFPQ